MMNSFLLSMYLIFLLFSFTWVAFCISIALRLSCTRGYCHASQIHSELIDELTLISIENCEHCLVADVDELHLSWIRNGITRKFADFENLRILKISKSNIHELKASILKNMNKLEKLVLDGNEIKYLQAFPKLRLKKLFLANNKIELIRAQTFACLSELKLLSLENNEIFYIEDVFNGLTNLHEVNLNRNFLQVVEPGTFDTNTELTEISVNHNELHDLPINIFKHNINLEILRLHGNQLTSLHKNLFRNNRILKWIELGDNNIFFIDTAALEHLENLQFIDLASNRCIDDSFPVEMNFQHLLELTKRNCHHIAFLFNQT